MEALFELCPSEYFDRRIGGRRPNNRIRSTICHPRETLASLGRQFQERDLIDFCADNMARFKRPKKVVFGELPKTATGKIQKNVLRERAKEL